jgi:Zn-dependent protease with chaperone function
VSALDPFVVAAAYPWRVALHSALAALACYAWTRRERLHPGRPKRWLLACLLVLPLLTAAVAPAGDAGFRNDVAWFDSARLLALPLVGEVRLVALAVALGLVTVGVSVWQEVVPALRRRHRAAGEPPAALVAAARALPGWERLEVRLVAGAGLVAAAGGWPRRPRLLLSEGILATLDEEALLAVVRHEHEHATPRRFWAMHVLFALRLLQLYNPAALWLFREYAVETEIECDRAAVRGGDPKPLARALLALYEGLHREELAARAVLRRRVELLLGGAAPGPDAIGRFEVCAATAILALVLPWVV